MNTEIDEEDIARLRAALARIARFVDRQVSGDGMTRTQLSVLGTTARLGPLGLSELAEVEGVNPTMLSRIVGKLEAAELLRRLADPLDHRAVRVEVTGKGRTLQNRLRRERTRLLVDHVRALPPARAAELAAALPAIELLAEGMRRPVAARR
ncbi:MAG TPA: MarR family transcriptional regulator [Mycobacteriales bacterium]|jgi:DNA-binding MarR family transcriptional regulator|nr:MarR family transcriptional regulator [Mycobacteriales bacterium]